MSPWLCNVYMDGVVREVHIKVRERGLYPIQFTLAAGENERTPMIG